MPGSSYEKIQTGDALPGFERVIEKDVYFAYNRLVNNLNPLHSDRDYAQKLGFEDIVVAGVYTYSFIPKLVEDWIEQSGRVTRVEIKFHGPVYLGRKVLFQGRVINKRDPNLVDIEVLALSPAGDTLISALVEAELGSGPA